MKTVVVFGVNDYAALTLETAKMCMPDAKIYLANIFDSEYNRRYAADHDIEILPDIQHDSRLIDVHRHLSKARTGIVYCVRSGALIQSDLFTAAPLDLLDFSLGLAKTYMFKDNPVLNVYDMMGLKSDDTLTTDLSFVNLDAPIGESSTDAEMIEDIELRKICMPLAMYFHYDPLVDLALEGLNSMLHHILAYKAYVIDYADQIAYDVTLEQLWACPFDLYSTAADKVKDYLAPEVYENMKFNAAKCFELTNGYRECLLNFPIDKLWVS